MTDSYHDRKIKYIHDYNKATYKQVILHLHKDKDSELIAKLDSVKSKNGYLKDLIRSDIDRAK